MIGSAIAVGALVLLWWYSNCLVAKARAQDLEDLRVKIAKLDKDVEDLDTQIERAEVESVATRAANWDLSDRIHRVSLEVAEIKRMFALLIKQSR
jgi:outer membrane murein-binding lipoprotein Lpp